MPGAVRQGDTTQGACAKGGSRHGSCVTCSGNVLINGKGAHRQGDGGPTNCGKGGNFISNNGSSSVFINGIPAARIGDSTQCKDCGSSGQHANGSSNVMIGG